VAFLTNLVSIRDALAAELLKELQRRAALVADGKPPPTDYSLGGKSVQWNAYVSGMQKLIMEQNKLVIAAGGEGIIEEWIRAY
jgi:hypothetical protein